MHSLVYTVCLRSAYKLCPPLCRREGMWHPWCLGPDSFLLPLVPRFTGYPLDL